MNKKKKSIKEINLKNSSIKIDKFDANAKKYKFQYDEAMNLINTNKHEDGIATLRDLAHKNYSKAISTLGQYYLEGKYLPCNYAMALIMLTRAHNLGDKDASILLAECFKNGVGVAANPARANLIMKEINS